MEIRKIFLILILLPVVSNADCPQLKGTAVIFGGRGSTTTEMQQCYPDLVALSNTDGDGLVNCLAKQINDIDPQTLDQKFIIAGHSSGSVQAERLVQKIKDKSKVRLVLLEGFASPANQRGVETTCWFARNRNLEGMNASYMQNPSNCTGQINVYENSSCRNSLCLHLSLVNAAAPPDLNSKTVFMEGLRRCEGNREWLNQ